MNNLRIDSPIEPVINQDVIVDTVINDITSVPNVQLTRSLRLVNSQFLTDEGVGLTARITQNNIEQYFSPTSDEYASLQTEFAGISSMPTYAQEILIGKRITATSAYIKSGKLLNAINLVAINDALKNNISACDLTFNFAIDGVNIPVTITWTDASQQYNNFSSIASDIQSKVRTADATNYATFTCVYNSQQSSFICNLGINPTTTNQYTVDYCASKGTGELTNYFANICGLTLNTNAKLNQSSLGLTIEENFNLITNQEMRFMSVSCLYDVSTSSVEYLGLARAITSPHRRYRAFFAFPLSQLSTITTNFINAGLAYNDPDEGFTFISNCQVMIFWYKDQNFNLQNWNTLLGLMHCANSTNLNPYPNVQNGITVVQQFPNMDSVSSNSIYLSGVQFTKAEKELIISYIGNMYASLGSTSGTVDGVVGYGQIGGGLRYVDSSNNASWLMTDIQQSLVTQKQNNSNSLDLEIIDEIVINKLNNYKKSYMQSMTLNPYLPSDQKIIAQIKAKLVGFTDQNIIDDLQSNWFISQTVEAQSLDNLAIVYLMGNDYASEYVQSRIRLLQKHGYSVHIYEHTENCKKLSKIPDFYKLVKEEDRVFKNNLLTAKTITTNLQEENKETKKKEVTKTKVIYVPQDFVVNKLCIALSRSNNKVTIKSIPNTIVGALPADIRMLGTQTTIIESPLQYADHAKIELNVINQLN